MEPVFTALQQGVKLIGIGKHGSKKLPNDLITEITTELLAGYCPPILVGAFIGAVLMKPIEPSYKPLELYFGIGSLDNPIIIWNQFCNEVSLTLRPIGLKLMNKDLLEKKDAALLGTFLMSEVQGEFFRGLAMSILRIRYESDAEYEGLYQALISEAKFPTSDITDRPDVIQLAEPFDGVEHSYMITPLLAQVIQQMGYTTILSCSRNPGPKIALNTHSLYHDFGKPFIQHPSDLLKSPPECGWAMNLPDFYPALEKWIDRRHILMKRPFLATIEKVLNPLKAKILITSVFHIPYLEKMVQLAVMAGFDGVIIMKRGLEGSLAPSLSKASGILCAARNKEGKIISTTILPQSQNKIEADAVIEGVSSLKNHALIQQYGAGAIPANSEFKDCVEDAIALYQKGLVWIQSVQS
jgi:anthranilate phosphoribosyltransferase